MKKNEHDIFESTNKSNISEEKNIVSSNNFFVSDNLSNMSAKFQPERIRKLNDYDYNLLKEDAYKNVSDELFKLEYKISKTEEEIKTLESKISAAKDIKDFQLVQELENLKKTTQSYYYDIISEYNKKSLSAHVTENISMFFRQKIKNTFAFICRIVSDFYMKTKGKMPQKFANVVNIRESLIKLENINKNVDDLITMDIPYGENHQKYEQLSKYIIKANSIQAEIARQMK